MTWTAPAKPAIQAALGRADTPLTAPLDQATAKVHKVLERGALWLSWCDQIPYAERHTREITRDLKKAQRSPAQMLSVLTADTRAGAIARAALADEPAFSEAQDRLGSAGDAVAYLPDDLQDAARVMLRLKPAQRVDQICLQAVGSVTSASPWTNPEHKPPALRLGVAFAQLLGHHRSTTAMAHSWRKFRQFSRESAPGWG